MFTKCCTTISFLTMAFVAGAISVYDNILNLIFMESLHIDERNPVASLIIEHWGVEGLIHLKSITTILAVCIMCGLAFSRKYRIVIVPVFFLQLLLFCYLTFYTPEFGAFFNEDFFLPFEKVIEFYRTGEVPSISDSYLSDNLIVVE